VFQPKGKCGQCKSRLAIPSGILWCDQGQEIGANASNEQGPKKKELSGTQARTRALPHDCITQGGNKNAASRHLSFQQA
jgi:hypothetical protein